MHKCENEDQRKALLMGTQNGKQWDTRKKSQNKKRKVEKENVVKH